MLSLLVRLSANAEIGMGHAVRTGALVKELLAQGVISEDIIVLGEGDLWRPFFPPTAQYLSMSDEDGILEGLVDKAFDLAVIDYPFPKDGDWAALKRAAKATIAIDDWGGNVAADIIFNGTVLERFHIYDAAQRALVFKGADYTLLRPEFATHSWSGADNDRVTVVIGSGEAARDWAFGLMQNWPAALVDRAHFVVGAGFDRFEALQALAQSHQITLKRGLDATCLVNLLCKSRLAITTGGMIAYEVIALNVPALINPQIDNLIDEIAWFASHGACIDLGLEGAKDFEAVFTHILALYEDRARLLMMAQHQAAILDGRGLYRLCDEIKNYLRKMY